MPPTRAATPLPAAPSTAPLRWWSQAWRLGGAFAVGLLSWGLTLFAISDEFRAGPDPRWLPAVDAAVGVLCLTALLWRRRFPRSVAVLCGVATAVSSMSSGAWIVAAISLSTRRRYRDIILLLLAALVGSFGFEALVPAPEPTPWWMTALFVVLVVIACSTTGWYIGARRDLLSSLEARALTAEAEQAARVAEARANERTAIAREMHDVLAHRISLIAMHAGALTYRTDLTAEQTSQAAGVIESNAHLALSDLRDVLGVLRSGAPLPEGNGSRRPQPAWHDVPALLDEARATGTEIVLTDTLEATPPTTIGRHAYRVVQEALTNARKHAPGCLVRVGVSGAPGGDLLVEVHNPLPRGATSGLPGAGLGLAGLTERAVLAGGTLAHGRTPEAGFRVQARFPWPVDVAGHALPAPAPTAPADPQSTGPAPANPASGNPAADALAGTTPASEPTS